MAYTLPNGDITFSSGEQLASAKMNDFSGNQSDLAAKFSQIHTKVNGLAQVADTGDYNDLLNTPTIPVPGNGELTIKVGGTTIASFKANQTNDSVADITIPGATIEQTTGTSTTNAMSQNAVTDALDLKQDKLTQAELDILALPITQALLDQITTNKNDIDDLDTALGNLPTRVTDLETDMTQAKLDINDLRDNKANIGTRLADYGIVDAYTVDEIDAMVASTFHYKGSVADMAALNAITGQVQGDTYNVTSTGDNYTWDGSAWDKLAGTVDLTAYYTKTEADSRFLQKQTGSWFVYGTDPGGADRQINYASVATPGTLAMRDSAGTLTVATPTLDAHAATKQYADNLITNGLASGGAINSAIATAVSDAIAAALGTNGAIKNAIDTAVSAAIAQIANVNGTELEINTQGGA